jgi:hypothetical protein
MRIGQLDRLKTEAFHKFCKDLLNKEKGGRLELNNKILTNALLPTQKAVREKSGVIGAAPLRYATPIMAS